MVVQPDGAEPLGRHVEVAVQARHELGPGEIVEPSYPKGWGEAELEPVIRRHSGYLLSPGNRIRSPALPIHPVRGYLSRSQREPANIVSPTAKTKPAKFTLAASLRSKLIITSPAAKATTAATSVSAVSSNEESTAA